MALTYSYKQVEAVLARVFAVRPEHRNTLEAKILHLKKLGLQPAKADSRGKPIAYRREDILRWSLILQLGLASFEAGRAHGLGERIWTAMKGVLIGTAQEPSDWFVFIPPAIVAPPLVVGDEDRRISFVAGQASDFEGLQAGRLSLVAVNLSLLRRTVDSAIDEVAEAAAPRRGNWGPEKVREIASATQKPAPAPVPVPAPVPMLKRRQRKLCGRIVEEDDG